MNLHKFVEKLKSLDLTNKLVIFVAIFGIVLFLIVSNAAPFKDTLFSALFPKPASKASNSGFDITTGNGTPITQPSTDTFTTDSLDVVIKLKDPASL